MAILTATASAAELLAEQWHLFLAPAFVYIAGWVFQKYFQENHLSQIPFVGTELGDEGKRRARYIIGAKDIYLEGYRKFKNGVFRISTPKSMEQTPSSRSYEETTDQWPP